MISVQIAINKLARAGLTAYLSERKDPRLIIKYNANSYRSLVVLDGFISERALNSVLQTVAKESRLEVA
jgi:hypothetical protein